MVFCEDICKKTPRKCPYSVENYDGESYYSGAPIRLYRPDDDCPELAKNKKLEKAQCHT